jgi:hypothetical protein
MQRESTAAPLAVVLVGLLACASHAPEPPRPAPTVARTLRYGGSWTHAGPRAATDAWLTYAFEARAGDTVEAYVRSSAGSPVARLADDAQRDLADSSIGHPDGDTVAGATFAASRTGTYYLLLRDASDTAATFEVQLVGRFACHHDDDCARAGEATGDPTAPRPLDVVPFCLFAEGDEQGACKGMTRESVEQLRRRP